MDLNATYYDKYISTLQTCRPRGPHCHKNLLPNIYNVESSSFQHSKSDICFPSNDNTVVGNKRDNLAWAMLPDLFRCRVLQIVWLVPSMIIDTVPNLEKSSTHPRNNNCFEWPFAAILYSKKFDLARLTRMPRSTTRKGRLLIQHTQPLLSLAAALFVAVAEL